jgi:dTDP-4-amino-4,6-dideoxygalactose transaminase
MNRPIVDSLNDERKIHDVMGAVDSIMRSGCYSEGEHTSEFEIKVCEHYHSAGAVSFSNCGAALYTIFSWLQSLGHNKIVLQNNTFYATVAMAVEAGLAPVVCDSSPTDPSMGVDSMIAAVTASKATVVCLTHVGGWVAQDYEAIATWCDEHRIVLIEDAAHVFGVRNAQGHAAGDLSTAACFSFYPTKAVPGGEGGVLIWRDWQCSIPEFSLEFRSYGKFKDSQGVIRYGRGFNLRMSEFDAAVLGVQMNYLDEVLANRLVAATQLQDAGFLCLMGEVNTHSNYYKYPVVAEGGFKQTGKVYSLTDQVRCAAKAHFVEYPVPLHNSQAWAQGHMCLPIGEKTFEGMTSKEIRHWMRAE